MKAFAGPLRRLRRRQREMLVDERGVTAVEFGMLGLPFFSIIAAILQTSLIFLSSQVLESAVFDASRDIRTGQVKLTGGTIETFRTEICSGLFGLFPSCDGLHIRVVSDDSFDDLEVVVPVAMDCTSPCNWSEDEEFLPGDGKSVVLVQVHYRYPVLIPLGALGMSNLGDGSRLMGSATVFQNEPFTY